MSASHCYGKELAPETEQLAVLVGVGHEGTRSSMQMVKHGLTFPLQLTLLMQAGSSLVIYVKKTVFLRLDLEVA